MKYFIYIGIAIVFYLFGFYFHRKIDGDIVTMKIDAIEKYVRTSEYLKFDTVNIAYKKIPYNQDVEARACWWPPVYDVVPNEETALKIAATVLNSYFKKKIVLEQPFKVSLKDDSVWIIRGSMRPNGPGGIASIKIRKDNGQIVLIGHEK